MEKIQMIERIKTPVIVHGSVSYYERSRCNCIIRIKKRLVKEFPDLINAKNVCYRAELWQTYDDLRNRIAEIKQKREGIPILLFLFK